MILREVTRADFGAILALNAGSVHFLSPLDADRLDDLDRRAAYHRVIEDDGRIAAFLLAFREGAGYDSPNYLWFAERYPTFLYIDRIVIDAAQRGRGLGVRLYEDIATFASDAGVPWLTCEFDTEPPNPVSAQFHARMGFREVGTQRVGGGKKKVSLQAKAVR